MPVLPSYPHNNRNIKVANRILIRSLIRDHGPISRKDLAGISGLTPAALTGIVRELIEDRTVVEVGAGKSSGGRRPIYLTLNPSAGYVLACRLQKGYLVTALVDLKSNVVAQKEAVADTSSPEGTAKAVYDHFLDLLVQAGVPREKVSMVSVASPGLINSRTGTIKRSVNLGWEDAPLGEHLAEAFGLPVHVENVSNASALAEQLYGHGRGCHHLIYVGLSVGIGAGIILDGQIVGGALGYAGEVGHLAVTVEGGAPCRCGSRGCFEAYCGTGAVVEKIRAGIALGLVSEKWVAALNGLDLSQAFQMLAEGEPYVKSVFAETAAIIGLVVANLINLYNPGVVVLGGELMKAGDEFLDLIRREASGRALGELGDEVRIVRSEMEADPGVMGAAAIALQKVFAQALS